jgi:hypothetical protein
MSKQETAKQTQGVKPDDLLLSVIKTDVNLSRLPFFALSRIGLSEMTEIEFYISETRGSERLELIWRVTANSRYGYPSPFAKKVHRAVEYLLTRNGFPVPGYLDFSFYEIEHILGLPHSGRTYDEMKHAMMSIALAGMSG